MLPHLISETTGSGSNVIIQEHPRSKGENCQNVALSEVLSAGAQSSEPEETPKQRSPEGDPIPLLRARVSNRTGFVIVIQNTAFQT